MTTDREMGANINLILLGILHRRSCSGDAVFFTQHTLIYIRHK